MFETDAGPSAPYNNINKCDLNDGSVSVSKEHLLNMGEAMFIVQSAAQYIYI